MSAAEAGSDDVGRSDCVSPLVVDAWARGDSPFLESTTTVVEGNLVVVDDTVGLMVDAGFGTNEVVVPEDVFDPSRGGRRTSSS